VAVAVNTTTELIAKDDEGEFIRATDSVTKTATGAVMCLTASGKKLGPMALIPKSGRSEQDLRKVLKAWEALPASERAPGAVKIPAAAQPDPKRVHHEPPANCLVLRVHNRPLARAKDGRLRYVEPEDYPDKLTNGASAVPLCDSAPRYREATRDYMWVTEAEWKSFIVAGPKVGAKVPVPPALKRRIILYHLVPSRGLGASGSGEGGWEEGHVLASELTVTVDAIDDARVRLRLQGFARLDRQWRNARVLADPHLTYEPQFLGFIEYDVRTRLVTRFDVLALGDVSGSTNNENNAGYRTGHNPLAIEFELVTGNDPVDRLYPRAASHRQDNYLGTAKPGK
jgi:hypothetical protein